MTAYQPFPRRTDSTQQTLFVFVLIFSIAYVVACGLCIYVLNASPDPLVGNAWLWITFAPLTIFPLLILFYSWIAVLSRAFFRAGRPGAVRRLPAYIAWRIGVIVSVVLTAILTSRPTSLEAFRHNESLWLVIRMVIGCMYIWCALSLRRAAATLPATAPRTPYPGYDRPLLYPPAGNPPPAYPPPGATWPPPAAVPPAGPGPVPWPAPNDNPWAPPATRD